VKHLMLAVLALTLMAGNCDFTRAAGVTIGGQALAQTRNALAFDLGNALVTVYRNLINELSMIGDEPDEAAM